MNERVLTVFSLSPSFCLFLPLSPPRSLAHPLLSYRSFSPLRLFPQRHLRRFPLPSSSPQPVLFPSPSLPLFFPSPSVFFPTFCPFPRLSFPILLLSHPSLPQRLLPAFFSPLPLPHCLLPSFFPTAVFPHPLLPSPHSLLSASSSPPAHFSLPHRFLLLSLSASSQHRFLWRRLFLPSPSPQGLPRPPLHPLASLLHFPAYSHSSVFPPLPLLPSPSLSSRSSPGLLPPTVFFFTSHRFLPISSHFLAAASVCRSLFPPSSPLPIVFFPSFLFSTIFFPSPPFSSRFHLPTFSQQLLPAALLSPRTLFSPLPLPTIFAPIVFLPTPFSPLSHCLSPRSSPCVRAPVSLHPVCLCAQAAP
ncbi:uncharacterized protein LOC131381279 [Hylobates moloch]|uniref:uncharacterized protein LOC131381279 n=1 Tax=Hylobates moloch TaxID=81572 RepID=UPI0026768D9C|nr:uncharacterized protein LOC131381279 [Hylobates moloch]